MYVCVCIYVYIYIYCTFVYLYLVVYNWFNSRHFNIFLIYFELGKHVCIFLHSFILWQIDTYTDSGYFQKEQWHFLKDTLEIGLFQKKNLNRPVVEDWRTFLKKSWNFRFATLPLETVNFFQRKKGFIPGSFAKLWYALSLAWKFQQGQKPRPMEIPYDFFLIIWSPLETPLLF